MNKMEGSGEHLSNTNESIQLLEEPSKSRLHVIEPEAPVSKSRLLGLTISAQAQTRIRRIPKTMGLISVWINMGLVMSAQTVTLPDMLPRIGANYETIATAIAIGSVTCVILIPFGVFCDRYYGSVNLVMSASLALVSVSCAVLPWTRSLPTFCLVNTLMVLGHTLQNPVGNFMMATLWKDEASCPLHIMHLGWGIGAFISPLMFRPFLSPDRTDGEIGNNTITTGVMETTDNTTVTHMEITSTIEIPYGILAGLNFLCAFVFVGFHCLGSEMKLNYEHTSRSAKEIFRDFCHPGKWANGNAKYGTIILVGVIAFYAGMESMGTPFHLFLFSFAIESKFKFSKHEASLLDAAFNLTYSIGRTTFGILTVFIPVQVLILAELVGVLIMMVCIASFLFTKYHLWVYVCFYAFMCGPLWPAGLSWSNKYILFTATFAMWIQIVPQFIGMGAKWIIGHLFQEVGPMYAMYFGLGAAVFLCVMMSMLQAYVVYHERKKV